MYRQIFEYHPVIGYRYVPELFTRLDHEGGGYSIQTNRLGFRCKHEVKREKPKNTFRILLFGDSFTAGDGVSNQNRYADILENEIAGLQILNFGLSGSGTDQQYLIFKEFVKEVNYDLLMICPLVENIRRVFSRYRLVMTRNGEEKYQSKPYFDLIDNDLHLRNVPVPKKLISEREITSEEKKYADKGGENSQIRKIVNNYLRLFKPIIQRISSYQPVPYYNDPNHYAWRLMKKILVKWTMEVGGRPVLISPIPLYHHVEQVASAEAYQERFRELAGVKSITLYDPLGRFWLETPKNRRRCRYNLDPHLTIYGHQVLADALKPVVTRLMSEATV